MKTANFIWCITITLIISSCNVNNELPEIVEETVIEKEVDFTNKENLDFSNYIAVGASFTAGFTDNALFKNAQENSSPNILATIFSSIANGGEFNQPLMEDNIGGLLFNGNLDTNGDFRPRLYFNGTSIAALGDSPTFFTPTTEVTNKLSNSSFNNMGVPSAKIYHQVFDGYGSFSSLDLGIANPYFVRFSSSENTSILKDVLAKNPSFFTLIDGGGNDVLGYALAGGGITNSRQAINQAGNTDFTTYGNSDITDPFLFEQTFSFIVNSLTENGAKGVVGNVPYVTSLPHFTTVPYNALDPNNEIIAEILNPQIQSLNLLYGILNPIFSSIGEIERVIEFSGEEANSVVIFDKNLTDLSTTISSTLANDPAFPIFIQLFGLAPDDSSLVAQVLGDLYGQARPAIENDLLLLTSSSVIGQINTDAYNTLNNQGLPEALANQLSIQGLTNPLSDNYVLTSEEQLEIKIATDAFNLSIKNIVNANDNIALLDLNNLLKEATISNLEFDNYILTTDIITGGLFSLDGIHLTARGNALLANKILETIDANFNTNFTKVTNGLSKAEEYPTAYSPFLR